MAPFCKKYYFNLIKLKLDNKWRLSCYNYRDCLFFYKLIHILGKTAFFHTLLHNSFPDQQVLKQTLSLHNVNEYHCEKEQLDSFFMCTGVLKGHSKVFLYRLSLHLKSDHGIHLTFTGPAAKSFLSGLYLSHWHSYSRTQGYVPLKASRRQKAYPRQHQLREPGAKSKKLDCIAPRFFFF